MLETIRNDEDLKDMLVVVITAWSHAELDARVAGADRSSRSRSTPTSLSGAVEELLAVTLARRMVARQRRRWRSSSSLPSVALIVAISAPARATAREARSRDVTAASLRLEKLVVDMETGHPRPDADERPQLPPAVATDALRALPKQASRVAGARRQRPGAAPTGPVARWRGSGYVEFATPLVASSGDARIGGDPRRRGGSG